MTRRRWLQHLAPLALTGITGGCGYQVGGKAQTIPRGINTIAIPAFGAYSTRYRLIDVLPQELSREFNTRTRFTAISNPDEADAVLRGVVNMALVSPTVFDPSSGRATTVQVTVVVAITLTQRSTGKVLFSRPGLTFKQGYSIAVDPHQFFDESGPAFDRLGQDLARDVVSAIVSDF